MPNVNQLSTIIWNALLLEQNLDEHAYILIFVLEKKYWSDIIFNKCHLQYMYFLIIIDAMDFF